MSLTTFLSNFTPTLISLRRQLHQLAELSTLEHQTGIFITQQLTAWGIPYRYPVAETGIVATIFGQKKEPQITVALRADMDALPIYEGTSCPYHSQNPGVMHACGHDAHMAIALGAARYFSLHRESFSGYIKIFFQPCEETIGGAAPMVEEGCMEDPHVDYVLGLHVAPYLDTGHIEVKYGKLYAASDELNIRLTGQSSHGAYPESGCDTIVMAAQLIQVFQSIISRQTSPLEPCVLSLGTIQGGRARNILADTVELTGILRTADPQLRIKLHQLLQQQATGLAELWGGAGQLTIHPGYDALINTDTLVDTLVEVATPLLGQDHIHWKPTPGMGVEDFSAFLAKAPGVFYHLGCRNEEKGLTAPLHSPKFSIDEDCLAVGLQLQISLTEALLHQSYSEIP